MKRIALFLPNLAGGGAERVMISLARGFAGAGLAVELVVCNAVGQLVSEVPPQVRMTNLGKTRVLASLPRFTNYLRTHRPDAILSTLNHANIVAIWARSLAGLKCRLAVREANVIAQSTRSSAQRRGRLVPGLMRLFYKRADTIIAVSEGVAAELVGVLKVPRKRIKVIYNPVVSEDFYRRADQRFEHPWFAPGQPPAIVAVGRLTAQKDLPTLIRAFANVRRSRLARLVILGEGEERAALSQLIGSLKLEGEVALPGFVENPLPFIKSAGVFALSSAWEGLPNVLIQALALSVPIVSTDCRSGPREILEDGKWGRLVPVGEVDALSEAILEALERPISSREAERAGQRLAAEKFRLDKVVGEYMKALSA